MEWVFLLCIIIFLSSGFIIMDKVDYSIKIRNEAKKDICVLIYGKSVNANKLAILLTQNNVSFIQVGKYEPYKYKYKYLYSMSESDTENILACRLSLYLDNVNTMIAICNDYVNAEVYANNGIPYLQNTDNIYQEFYMYFFRARGENIE